MHTDFIPFRSLSLDEKLIADSSYWMCRGGECGACAKSVLELADNRNDTLGDVLKAYSVLGEDFGSVSLDRKSTRLSCHPLEQKWFDVMRSYGDIGDFLSIFSLFGIILYFVTSSDSGSLVIDCLSANGDADPPKLQRVFWALMEGATATALLVAGGQKGLIALQTAGILSGNVNSNWLGRSGFFSILLTHEGSHREAYRDFQPSLTSSAGGAKGCSDHRFRVLPAYTAQLLSLHQHRADFKG